MNRLAWHVLLAMFLFAMFSAVDLWGEDEPISPAEFLTEDAWPWALLSVALAAASELAWRFRASQVEREGLAAALAASQIDGERWRSTARQHSEGLGQAINAQFGDWRLTASESDVAMLLLKGLSHKEVASLRNASSATVRQQAAVIYQKSGLASRAELAAFFLEDLFPSRPDPAASPAMVLKPAPQPRPELIQHMS